MSNFDNKKFFIIEESKSYTKTSYRIHDNQMYDLQTAVRKVLALDTLNEDKENDSYHLQEVDFSMVDKPLVLTDEVKETDQEELPF